MTTKRKTKPSAVYFLAVVAIPVASLLLLAALSVFGKPGFIKLEVPKEIGLSAIVASLELGDH